MNDAARKFIIELSKYNNLTQEKYFILQRKFAKKYKCGLFSKEELNKVYQKLVISGNIENNQTLLSMIRMKNTRSHSGIAVVSVLTKPYPCSGECIYCPTERGVPKSYLSNEPAVMRAILCKYHPYLQTKSRLDALSATGHIIDKISIRIIGGTWSEYPKRYQSWYISQLFKACNEFGVALKIDLSLAKQQEYNQTAKIRIVELSIETRQDRITDHEAIRLRKLGITKVELGVQSVNDYILNLNGRNCPTKTTAIATRTLKDYGFKVSYQMMLNLLGSTPQSDFESFLEVFNNEAYKPDHLKIYPLALLENSKLFTEYKIGNFIPYDELTLVKTLAKIKSIVPEYCRIERVIRDIPAENIVEGGTKISNLRQDVQRHMEEVGKKCKCIRCREIKDQVPKGVNKVYVIKYYASGSNEYFISVETTNFDKQLRGFLRIREIKTATNRMVGSCYMIREIHVYGPTVAIGSKNKDASQHQGIGKLLLAEAEKIAENNGAYKICVIAGVGVREYFHKLGYKLYRTYMVKNLPANK